MIVRTLLDTDLYKFTTSYAYIKLFPYAMDWGPVGEVMEIYSEDLITGKAQSKIGYTVYDDEVQMPEIKP